MEASIDVNRQMDRVVAALRKAGYDSVSQLVGYYKTGDPTYITRTDDARGIIQSLDQRRVRQYIEWLHRKTEQ